MSVTPLRQRRREIEAARRAFDPARPQASIDDTIRASWGRCRDGPNPVVPDPVGDEELARRWHSNPIRGAASDVLARLGDLVAREDYVATVLDHEGVLLWWQGSNQLLDLAERSGFVAGSTWTEAIAGTNGPGTALAVQRPVAVFANEHWRESAGDWVCYAAPIHDQGGRLVGALDLSARWDHASDLVLETVVAMSQLIGSRIEPAGDLRIRVLGHPDASGLVDHLPLRRIEILLLLAWHRQLDLSQLHDLLYGERPASLATTKAEVSALRADLGRDAIASRPYRLGVDVELDAVQMMDSLLVGDTETASRLYRGEVLSHSQSPGVVAIRNEVRSCLRAALLSRGNGVQLARYSRVHRWDVGILEAITAREPAESFTAAWARARLESC